MKTIFHFDIKTYLKSRNFIVSSIALLGFGVLVGLRFNLSIGEDVLLNSPYTIGFMTGMLSLIIIFIASLVAYQMLFKEWDNRFDALLFTTSVRKKDIFLGRFTAFFIVTFFCFTCMHVGFVIGLTLRNGENINQSFNLSYFVYPLLIFGFLNSLLICSVLISIAWLSKNKLLVATGGLFIYIFYMVSLLFSGSPFMANTSPQSIETQYISALFDPFGLSGYFSVSSHFSPQQRNELLVPLSGVFLVNRIIFFVLSGTLLFMTYRKFNFYSTSKKYIQNTDSIEGKERRNHLPGMPLQQVPTLQNTTAVIKSIFSFVKTDLIYLFRSIPFIVTSIFFLFYVGMEMYAEIEKGIRIPQKYASSGLMATTINENLHFLSILAGVYFLNDIYWRSRQARFYEIESSNYYASKKVSGHSITVIVLHLFISALCICMGLLFQILYGYGNIDWGAYFGVFLFTTSPVVLFTVFALLLNHVIPNKYVALCLSFMAALLLSTSYSNTILPHPLFRFFTGFIGPYSDFTGYGTYSGLFAKRQIFGLLIFLFVVALYQIQSTKKIKKFAFITTVLVVMAVVLGSSFSKGYLAHSKDAAIDSAEVYEQRYKHYNLIPQPVITDVKTRIHLYPTTQSYTIEGHYIIKNKNEKLVKKFLLQFEAGYMIQQAKVNTKYEQITISNLITEVNLKSPLLPGDTATFDFTITYLWKTVNGHNPLNAIVEDGSFMRISRYFPQIGYKPEKEINDEDERKKRGMLKKITTRKLADSTRSKPDFIQLDMIVSTDTGQTAVGTGRLVKHWTKDNRNFFQFLSDQPIPFRFAVSSAAYNMKFSMYKGIKISVLYHPSHIENVDHLIHNAQLTLDYCIQNFGPYPFNTITFAEVSSFTSGFAATAYPGCIFMTEQMIFHANINSDQHQDVINELAGHELSHLWWGCNQILPDDREGATMLTETLAMYTEMMLYKKMYGAEKMKERVEIHRQIYEAEKGFSENEPLYKVSNENIHISYSKGAMVMVDLSNLIGEETVNKALSNFLLKFKYPAVMPLSTDLINEFLYVSNPIYHQKIKTLFMNCN